MSTGPLESQPGGEQNRGSVDLIRGAGRLVSRAARQVRPHITVIGDLLRYLERGELPSYTKSTNRQLPRYERPFLVSTEFPAGRVAYVAVDAFERTRPFRPLPLIEEANIRARVAAEPLHSRLDSTGDASAADAPGGVAYFTFTNVRSFEDNLADLVAFVGKQEENVQRMGEWSGQVEGLDRPAYAVYAEWQEREAEEDSLDVREATRLESDSHEPLVPLERVKEELGV